MSKKCPWASKMGELLAQRTRWNSSFFQAMQDKQAIPIPFCPFHLLHYQSFCQIPSVHPLKFEKENPRWIIDTKWPFPFINKHEKTASISQHHNWCSQWNDVWAMTAEIQHWWPITSQIWGVLPLGGGKFLSRHNHSKAVSRSS